MFRGCIVLEKNETRDPLLKLPRSGTCAGGNPQRETLGIFFLLLPSLSLRGDKPRAWVRGLVLIGIGDNLG
jgi:hypothetical protein